METHINLNFLAFSNKQLNPRFVAKCLTFYYFATKDICVY